MSTDDTPTEVDPLGSPRSVRMVRRFDAPRSHVYRCWTVPEEMIRWFPQRIEGSLAVGTLSVLVFPDQRVWWDPNRPEAVGLLFRQTCPLVPRRILPGARGDRPRSGIGALHRTARHLGL